MNNQIIDFYEKKYRLRSLGPAEKIRVKKIVDLSGKNKIILDIGCDTGLVGKYILKNKNKVYGIDISKKAVIEANNNGLIAKRINPETQALPFKNNYFDLIIMTDIIEHLFDPDKVFQKIRKKLKLNGELIITTPNLASLTRRIQLFLGLNPSTETRLNKYSAGHIRYFVKKNLFELLSNYKFKVIHFSSDLIHLTPNGKINTTLIPYFFPTLGRTLIIKAVKL
ncbi:hypothetical protein COT75_05045 [Candidatus Beckwithbacteria bacterium CG10_big_fil_rev_8_21_14_0_10_34_10]|uniref:Methyltransferase type 11 domain-containing protein n=1 Tax=Candidatus Beckwithbacteria bacterium CG10_big_fil_rev_8_21_14_0_10_34_10 TaxID=1974495 RepID=A0A2H0W861_9BACT|nr:MAG: hypothetical protein COT75_05045 [Candidatus Beckwithbacteria bacterium CG10_big_fil_rev_8_21_14_0_10_34_10]